MWWLLVVVGWLLLWWLLVVVGGRLEVVVLLLIFILWRLFIVVARLRGSFLLNLNRRLLHLVENRGLLVLLLGGLFNFCRNYIACRWWPLILSLCSCSTRSFGCDGCCWCRVCWTRGLLHGDLLRWNLILNNNHSGG